MSPPTPLSRTPPAFREAKKQPIALVLDQIRSGHNVGAAFRLGDAFQVQALYLCGITPRPPHPQIHKTALGAEATVPWTAYEKPSEILQQLKEEGYQLVAVEQAPTAVPILHFPQRFPDQPLALIFGNEVFGVSKEVLAQADCIVEIPQYGTKRSLNVSTAMAIALWEAFREASFH